MEKDSRRARGQWRGCYAFDNIIYDGDGTSSPTRKGGLKMGHTYWYYYKLDGDNEIHDSTLPSTTACPLLPGQQVNFMSVPVEEAPLRDRSASVGSYTEPLKTMDPAAKYETPRPPPPTPKLLRLNTTTGYEHYARKRPSRSESPKSSRSPWSPRIFFGPRTPTVYSPSRDRGPSKKEGDSHISYPILISRTDEGRKCVSLTDVQQRQTRPVVDQRSPLRRNSLPKLDLPADFAVLDVDDEDDANFATRSPQQQQRDSQLQPTVLSPPPSRINSVRTQTYSREHTPTLRLLTALSAPDPEAKSKPLPCLPTPGREVPFAASTLSLRRTASRHTPPISQIRTPNNDNYNPYFNLKSHFSLDSLDEVSSQSTQESHKSIDTTLANSEIDPLPGGMISPTDSDYSNDGASSASPSDFSETETTPIPNFNLSITNLTTKLSNTNINNTSTLTTQTERPTSKLSSPIKSGFHSQHPSTTISEVSPGGFQGYSLPNQAEYGSDVTLRHAVTIVEAEDGSGAGMRSVRGTFGGLSPPPMEGDAGSLGQFLDEMGYLGEAISR